jgi:hypothetical protein
MAEPYGLLAEFDTPEALTEAVKRLRSVGFRRIEAYTPFPVEDVTEALKFRDRRIPLLTLGGGILGIVLALAMQYGVNFDYPIEVGGRPLYAFPAFLVVTFELMILFSVLAAVGGMLLLNRLPKLHHPIFNAGRFRLASNDRFFLCLRCDDPQYGVATRSLLEKLGPRSLEVVPW